MWYFAHVTCWSGGETCVVGWMDVSLDRSIVQQQEAKLFFVFCGDKFGCTDAVPPRMPFVVVLNMVVLARGSRSRDAMSSFVGNKCTRLLSPTISASAEPGAIKPFPYLPPASPFLCCHPRWTRVSASAVMQTTTSICTVNSQRHLATICAKVSRNKHAVEKTPCRWVGERFAFSTPLFLSVKRSFAFVARQVMGFKY